MVSATPTPAAALQPAPIEVRAVPAEPVHAAAPSAPVTEPATTGAPVVDIETVAAKPQPGTLRQSPLEIGAQPSSRSAPAGARGDRSHAAGHNCSHERGSRLPRSRNHNRTRDCFDQRGVVADPESRGTLVAVGDGAVGGVGRLRATLGRSPGRHGGQRAGFDCGSDHSSNDGNDDKYHEG
ncbi:MAG: hypothetical protein QM783_18705 [Phycisphaerales bacterium]